MDFTRLEAPFQWPGSDMGGAGFVYYNSLLLRAISIASEDNDHWELVQFALMKKVNLL
jgi:hypothetical protein